MSVTIASFLSDRLTHKIVSALAHLKILLIWYHDNIFLMFSRLYMGVPIMPDKLCMNNFVVCMIQTFFLDVCMIQEW